MGEPMTRREAIEGLSRLKHRKHYYKIAEIIKERGGDPSHMGDPIVLHVEVPSGMRSIGLDKKRGVYMRKDNQVILVNDIKPSVVAEILLR